MRDTQSAYTTGHLDQLFGNRPVSEANRTKVNAIQDAAKQFARVILQSGQPNSDQMRAIDHVRDAAYLATQGLDASW